MQFWLIILATAAWEVNKIHPTNYNQAQLWSKKISAEYKKLMFSLGNIHLSCGSTSPSAPPDRTDVWSQKHCGQSDQTGEDKVTQKKGHFKRFLSNNNIFFLC